MISVIIPVYRVETYLCQCVDSVIGQSYQDLEILLIDDGSPDNCGKICDEYAAKDSRVRVFHQKNGGAANAKNTGLRAATGEYLAFLDADDYLEPDAYEYMLSEMMAAGADVIQCAFRDIFVNKCRDVIVRPKKMEFTAIEYLRRFTMDWTCGLIWDKLFRRDLFDGIFFEEGHRIDDDYFTYQGIMNASRILCLPHVVYNYRKRASGVMKSPETQKQIVLDNLDFLDKRRVTVLARFPELKQDYDLHYLSRLVVLSKSHAATEQSIRLTQDLLRAYFREKDHSRVGFAQCVELFRLIHTKPKHWLKKNKQPEIRNKTELQLFD